MAFFNKETTLKLLIEKASTEKYHKDKFKKKYNFEADRYAANKTSEKAMKKSLDQSYKFARSEKEKKLNKRYDNTNAIEKKRMNQEKSAYNLSAENDKNQRFKALKDSDMKKSDVYKESLNDIS